MPSSLASFFVVFMSCARCCAVNVFVVGGGGGYAIFTDGKVIITRVCVRNKGSELTERKKGRQAEVIQPFERPEVYIRHRTKGASQAPLEDKKVDRKSLGQMVQVLFNCYEQSFQVRRTKTVVRCSIGMPEN